MKRRVSRIAGRHGAQVGGFTLAPGGKRVVVVATLDNLLKGAATQAMQNPQPRAGHRRTDVDPALNTPSGAPMADLFGRSPASPSTPRSRPSSPATT
jgi:hypothetical protein